MQFIGSEQFVEQLISEEIVGSVRTLYVENETENASRGLGMIDPVEVESTAYTPDWQKISISEDGSALVDTREFGWMGVWTDQARLNRFVSPTNLPNPYIDTQALDGNYRAFTIGSTAAEQLVLNRYYYYTIDQLYEGPNFNRTNEQYRRISFEFETFSNSGAEGDAWGGGTQGGTKYVDNFIEEDSGHYAPCIHTFGYIPGDD